MISWKQEKKKNFIETRFVFLLFIFIFYCVIFFLLSKKVGRVGYKQPPPFGGGPVVTIFLNFAVLLHRFAPPQVKQNLISSITNLVYELPHKLQNDLILRKLGNIGKSSNSDGAIAQRPASLPSRQ